MLDNENQKLDKNLVNDANRHHNNKLNDINSNIINFNDDKTGKTITVVKKDNTINNAEGNNVKDKDIDEEMMEEIVRQTKVPDFIKGKKYGEITAEDWDKITTPQFKESIRKVKELLDE
jgi:hypothetical protein